MAEAAAPLAAAQARCLHLAALGLLDRPRSRATPATLLAAIERMRLLQIDTIHVVARSPYLVLHARLGDYDPAWLEQALAQGDLIECWAHEACFAPVADWPWHRAHQAQRRHWSARMAQRCHDQHGAAIAALVARIRSHGAVRASDFERADGQAGGWWGWKPEKRWLEAAFARGELLVARRERFQRVYDVPERVLAGHPDLLKAELPTADAVRARFVLDAVRALGIAQPRWLADWFRLDRKVTPAELAPWLADGTLLQVEVDGWNAPGYVHREHAGHLAAARAGALAARHATLLSPFDPLVWDRERVLALFGFDYRLECYTPEAKRQYGYFVLPILDRDRLVGRLDAKAHREAGVFEVKALYLEDGVRPGAGLARRVAGAIRRSAAWQGVPQVEIGRCEPVGFGGMVREALAEE